MSAAFNLSIPIFDWGASRSRERQARLRAQIAENERTIALRGFARTVLRGAGAGHFCSRAHPIGGDWHYLKPQNNLNASIARYRAGEAQIIEVTDAQTTLVAQRQALYQALFDYQVALARLRQATGR